MDRLQIAQYLFIQIPFHDGNSFIVHICYTTWLALQSQTQHTVTVSASIDMQRLITTNLHSQLGFIYVKWADVAVSLAYATAKHEQKPELSTVI